MSTCRIVFCAISLSLFVSNANALCCLCEHCKDPVSGRGNLHIDQKLTCDLAFNYLFDEKSDLRLAYSCSTLQERFRDSCCNETSNPRPVEQEQEPDEGPTANMSRGPYQTCELCSNKNYPKKAHNFIAVLYHGTRTCGKLWEEGQTGNLDDKLCNPLQDFAFDVCDCSYDM